MGGMSFMNFLKHRNKLIAIFLSVIMLITCFGTTAVADEEKTNYWSGEIIAPEKGSGSLADPYLIETPEQFAYMLLEANGGDNWDKNAVYSLTTDIYLNDITKINWLTGEVAEGYTPNYWNPEHFSGIIQGNGYMVYGLYIDNSPEVYSENFSSCYGLISTNWSNKWVKITDMGMDCVYIDAPNTSGVLMGGINLGSSNSPKINIEGCYIGNQVTVSGFATGGFVGGGNGERARLTVKNCASLATEFYDRDATGTRRYKAGAIVGDVWSTNSVAVENCYALMRLCGNGKPKLSYVNVFSTVKHNDEEQLRSFANMQGMDALINDKKMLGLGNGFTATETFPLPTAIYNNITNKNNRTKIWDGTTSAPTKGSGTLSDPYLIETPEEFAYMMLEANGGTGYDNGGTYKLMNDIYLNDINKINWETGEPIEGYTPNQWNPEAFTGIIQGNGHTVYGLYIEKSPESYAEKWGGGSGAALISENVTNKWVQINNMGMDCVYVNSKNVSGVFMAGAGGGESTQIIFNGCYIGSKVTVKGFAAGGFIGGCSGTNLLLKIKNCMSLATNFFDNNRNRFGGIIGDVWGTTNDCVDNCYALTRVFGNIGPKGSFINNYSAVKNTDTTTSTTQLDKANMQGKDVLTSETKMPNLGSGFVATEEYPYPAAFYGTLIEADEQVEKIWSGETVPPVKGDGTEASPYEIATAEQLAYAISVGSGNYKLVSDIYLNDIDKIDWATGTPAEGYEPNMWYADKAFSGTIDGNGHTVYGLYYNSDSEKSWSFGGVALIPRVADSKTATLKNIGIENAYINAPNAVGGLFGSNQTGVAVAEQCFIGENVTLCGYETGAFLGLDTGEFHFENCYSLAETKRGIEGNSACDIGLVGEFYVYPAGSTAIANSSMTNCFNTTGGGSTKGALGNAKNVYTATSAGFGTTLSASEMKGTVMDTNKMALSDAFVATEGYPVLRVFGDFADDYWSGLAHGFTEGDGLSPETSYKISTAGQLAYVVAKGGDGAYYSITNDIYLNEIAKVDWSSGKAKDGVVYEPVKWFKSTNEAGTYYDSAFGKNLRFSGNVDGYGHTVYGILNDNDGVSTIGGLFPAAVGANIKNLKLSHSYIASGRFGGSISGYFSGNVENVVVADTVSLYGYESINHESSSIGGIIGYSNHVYLKNCAFTGKMSATSAVGHVYSLVGTSWASSVKAENCFGIGRQPYTVSHGAKNFDTLQAAKDYFDGLYGATNVYTDTKANDNVVSFTYGEGKTAGSYSPFSFTLLQKEDMKGANALNTMGALSKNLWKTTESYPDLKKFVLSFGDMDGDGISSTEKDILVVRRAIISGTATTDGDFIGDGSSDICDLVKMTKAEPQCISEGIVYTYKKWNGIEENILYYMLGSSESESAARQLMDAAARRGDTTAVHGGLSYSGKQINFYIDSSMNPAEYTTDMVGSNLLVTAGSSNALMRGVEIIGELYTDEYVPMVSGVCEYDNEITLSSGTTYTYVWGDEFYGTTLDRNKWVNTTSNSKMSGFKDTLLLDTEEAVFVKDGKLTLRAMEYTDPNNADIKYGVPASVHTQGKMEFRYGYAEIYARVPFKLGVWPSFWATGDTKLGGRKYFDYTVEVDMFEIFGNVNTVVPNIHKWYKNYDYNTIHNQTSDSVKGHTQFSGKKTSYVFSDYSNLSNEFHLYGFEWTPTEISMYVDGVKFMTFDILKSYDLYDDMKGFQDPLFLIFNNHVFTPEYSFQPSLITGREKENLPADYEIDWLRVYQNKEVAGSEVYTP